MVVLDAVNWAQSPVGVLLVEDFWLSNRELDMTLTRSWFVKAQQLPNDALYVATSHRDLLPSGAGPWWVRDEWEYARWWKQTRDVREMSRQGRTRQKLAPDL